MSTITPFTEPLRPDGDAALRALSDRVGCPVVTAGDDGWDDARRAWNLAADQHPFAVAVVESAEDVSAVVRVAGAHGLRLAPQATGHGAKTLPALADTILVKTAMLRDVEIDAGARRARIGAGAQWGDVIGPAAEQGFVALHGSSPDVGVVGYTLGGGLGWLARSRGLAADSVVAVELVTAAGRIVRADREHEPDLFWAVRGGGGSFGIVTAIEIELFETPDLYAGALFWPLERAAEVLRAWRDWVATVPDEVTSLGRILHVPPLPDVPEALRGKSFAVVEAVVASPGPAAAELLRPLRELGPAMDTFATVGPLALPHLHMDPRTPVPAIGDGMLLDDLTDEAIEAVVAGAAAPLLSLELRHLGGALATPMAGQGAVGTLDAGYLMYAVGVAVTPETGSAVAAIVDGAKAALRAWECERAYFNFATRPVDAGRLFPAQTLRRLRRIRAAVDPGEIFVANHRIPAQG
jgi:FAD/FMN-containing dehydrogenase